jgi:hypothetical protein
MTKNTWLLVILLIASTSAVAALTLVPFASRVCCICCEFTSLPDSDKELQNWFCQQPGIVAHTVAVTRRESSMQLEVTFIQVRSLAGQPSLPKPDEVCRELGYVQGTNHWRACRSMHERPAN